jgi:hypothetical protein
VIKMVNGGFLQVQMDAAGDRHKNQVEPRIDQSQIANASACGSCGPLKGSAGAAPTGMKRDMSKADTRLAD